MFFKTFGLFGIYFLDSSWAHYLSELLLDLSSTRTAAESIIRIVVVPQRWITLIQRIFPYKSM